MRWTDKSVSSVNQCGELSPQLDQLTRKEWLFCSTGKLCKEIVILWRISSIQNNKSTTSRVNVRVQRKTEKKRQIQLTNLHGYPRQILLLITIALALSLQFVCRLPWRDYSKWQRASENVCFLQTNSRALRSFVHIRSSTSCSSQYSICCFATSRSNLFQCARLHDRTHSNRYVSAIERLFASVHYQACQSILRPIQCSIGIKTAKRTRLLSVTSETTSSTDPAWETTASDPNW